MRHSLIKMVLVVCFLTATIIPAAASVHDDLERLAQVAAHTISRLESGIELELRANSDFSDNIVLQFELSAIALNYPVALEEDYYHLGLSIVAKHFTRLALARSFLQKELDTQKSGVVRAWLQKEITDLELLIKSKTDTTEAKQYEPTHNYREIISDLQRTLAKAGIY